MSLQRKFFLVFTASLVIAVTLSVWSIRSVDAVHRSYFRVADETFPLVVALEDLRYAALRIVASTSEYGLVSVIGQELDETQERSESLEQEKEELLGQGADGFRASLAALDEYSGPDGSISSDQRAEFEQIGARLLETSDALRTIIDAQGDMAAIGELKERMEDLEGEILARTTSAIAAERNRMRREYATIVHDIHGAENVLYGHAALFALLLLGFWLLIIRSVLKPVKELNHATAALSNGDFSSIPNSDASDELGALTRAFGEMARSLKRLIAEREDAVKQARENETRFRDVADAASDWIWETDVEHRISFLSERFANVTGLAIEDMIGKPLNAILQSEIGPDDDESCLDLESRVAVKDVYCRVTTSGEGVAICRASGKPVFDADGAFKGYRGTVTDITDQVHAERRAQHLALHDALTGLPNRTLLAERMRQSITEARREKSTTAVICLDLDRFKEVNDTLGHSAGDALLKIVAERLTSLTRASDTVARLGGDEFVIVQSAANQPTDAHRLCQRILDALGKPIDIGEHTVLPAASIGIAMSPDDGSEPDELMRHADIAMYRSKKDGRGNFCFFKPSMNEDIQKRKRTEADLRSAMSNDTLELYFQPLVSARAEGVVGFEALVRWRHPDLGLIQPDEFIPLAEETGLILSLGEWVLRNACLAATKWPDQFVAVNLSPVQFRDQALVETIARTLESTGLAPERLELEITENVLLSDADYAFMVLDALRDLGVRIAMDDFGTGYSSLSYLQRFQFDKIKLDRGFVGAVGNSDDADAIVKAILTLGRSLGMTTTAEGVETDRHVEFLKRENCDQFQGFYFSEPIPADQIPELLADGAAVDGEGRRGAAREVQDRNAEAS